MVVLNRIYTRTGDAGTTALGDGQRVSKTSRRVEAYGTVDETNSALGMTRLHADGPTDAALMRIQNDLFDLGADLCRPVSDNEANSGTPPLRVTAAQTQRLENEIDAMNEQLTPLRSFVLPGGSALAASLHHCRTVSRRAERLTIALSQDEDLNPESIRYLNRLSDWFFVAARTANDCGNDDVLWVPGANREQDDPE